jgi:gliding motility-associated-like protein
LFNLFKILFLLLALLLLLNRTEAQCNQQFYLTSWQNFSGTSATGSINNSGQTIGVSMNSNFSFGSSPGIDNYAVFSGFNSSIPNSTVPQTNRAVGTGGVIIICFDQAVTNPVLLFSSLGTPDSPATLQFSTPYWVTFNGGGMTYNNDTSITGKQGFTILLFPGTYTCLTIYSNTPGNYGNITAGLQPPLFPVNITGKPENCDSVTLTASGGFFYSWNGGNYPIGAVNTFNNSGTYFVNVRGENGCNVITAKTITVKHSIFSTVSKTICEGDAVSGYTAQGTYIDHFVTANSCDSVRTLVLTVNHVSFSTINRTVCEGDSVEGHITAGIFINTFIAADGCDSIRTLHLTVVKKPVPSLGQAQTICTGDSLNLYPGSFDSYLWQNGSAQNHFVVKQTGMYKVSVKNICGSADAEVIITEMNCMINVPNAFSPNGDGINDNWKIPLLYNFPNCKLEVFNRYGQRLFYSEGYNQPWNGTYNGKLLPVGTYYWMITLQPGKTPLHGSVTIIL